MQFIRSCRKVERQPADDRQSAEVERKVARCLSGRYREVSGHNSETAFWWRLYPSRKRQMRLASRSPWRREDAKEHLGALGLQNLEFVEQSGGTGLLLGQRA